MIPSYFLKWIGVTAILNISHIALTWYRDAKGYKLVPWKSLIDSGQPINRTGDCIVADGGRWIAYRPLEVFDTLYVAFASVKTPDDLLKFINRFGPLTPVGFAAGPTGPEPVSGGANWGDDVNHCLKQARLFRELLMRQRKPQAIARLFRSELRAEEVRSHTEAYDRAEAAAPATIEVDRTWSSIPPLFDLIIDARLGIRLRLRTPRRKVKPVPLWLSLPIAEIDLIPDPQKGVQLRLKTESLLSALWWQLGQRLSGQTMMRECRHCGTLFEVGPGSNRRTDATFCSHEHSVRFHSLRRSIGG